jgi:hypothetical protein
MISFNNGVPTDEEADELERQIADKFAGTDNAGRFILNFSDSKDRSAEITPITPSNLDKQYQVLEERIDNSLLVAHRVINPILFGWKQGNNGFSNNADEMRVAMESYQHRYATPKQESKEDLFNSILLVNGIPGILAVKPLEPIMEKLTLQEVIPHLTQDEIREMAGFEPLNNTDSQFKTQNDKDVEKTILDHFNSCGISEDEFEVLSVKELECTNIEEFMIEDDQARNELMKFAVIPGLTEIDIAVMQQLQNNPNASTTDIARALDITEGDVAKTLAKLQRSGAIAVREVNGIIERTVTKDGVDTIVEEAVSPRS